MKNIITTIVGVAALFVLSACSSNSSSHPTTTPSGANSTTHGTAKSGMPSGPDAGR